LSFWILFEISKEVGGATLHTESEILPQGADGLPSKLFIC